MPLGLASSSPRGASAAGRHQAELCLSSGDGTLGVMSESSRRAPTHTALLLRSSPVALPFPGAPATAFLDGALGTSVGMRGLYPPPRDWVGSPGSQPDGPSSRGFNWEK